MAVGPARTRAAAARPDAIAKDFIMKTNDAIVEYTNDAVNVMTEASSKSGTPVIVSRENEGCRRWRGKGGAKATESDSKQ